MKRTSCGAIVASVALGVPSLTLAEGVSVDIDVVAIASWDEFGDSPNVVLTVDVADLAGFGSGTGVVVTGIGYDLTIETFMFSWLSEGEINFDDADGPLGGFSIIPGDGDDMAGTMNYTQALTKFAPGDQLALSMGLLRIEFYEGFDDVPDVIDAEWNGTITLQIDIPSPGPAALFGCGALSLARRRR